MYGWAEEVAGEILTSLGLRDRMFIATKVWTQGRERGIEQMRDSMRKLRVDRIDLMQVHNLVDTSAHLDTLRRWKAEGLVRYIGVTHYSDRAHADVARVLRQEPLDFVQINYSVAERAAERSILPLAAERGVAVIANRPLAAGAALGPLRERPVPEWASELGLHDVVAAPAQVRGVAPVGDVRHSSHGQPRTICWRTCKPPSGRCPTRRSASGSPGRPRGADPAPLEERPHPPRRLEPCDQPRQ